MAIRKHAAALSAGALLVLYGAQASGQSTTTTVGAPVTLYAPSGAPIGQDSGHPLYVTGGTGGTGGSSNSVTTGSTSAAATPVQDAATGAPLELNSTGQSILTKLSGVLSTLATLPPTATDTAATITTANTFQVALAANVNRHSCTIISKVTNTDPLLLFFGSGTATVAAAVPLAPGAMATCQSADQVQISGPTANDAFVVISQ